MRIFDLDGTLETDDLAAVEDRLRSVRQGSYGACYVAGESDYPYIAVHFNDEAAYLHYFPADGHPGFQAADMTPDGVADTTRFVNIDGLEGSAFGIPPSAIVDSKTAIAAVLDFVAQQVLPTSIEWCEL
jgi:hypothetical protein